ncbi:myosin light chain kinase, smooth muscle isoform X1 [Anguilla anguilla]|uniref:myosin light chain kinase, smooth muscle isoform X1 n=1 Tax=Anguilla anguilla TaxID=7936 RepID=UPI0015B1C5B2|nr:myosin light chain kinase, smooth muscle isoform X1 [Anguilla anguilla]XP_035261424.1 myosin light chain kinase, smooth muscle isoform X1 [Anguilla anguilla]
MSSLLRKTGSRRQRSPVRQEVVPFFLLPPRNAAVYPGDTAAFFVKVQGQPEPTVAFFIEGVPVAPGGQYCFRQLGRGVHIFTVTNVNPTNAGRYMCEVINCAGQVQASFRLQLKVLDQDRRRPIQRVLRRVHSWGESHPRFVSKPYAVTVKEGDRVEFKARVTGRPPPSVTWLKDWAPLPGRSTAHCFFSAGFHLLELQVVRREDQGLYTCQIHSPAGESSASAQLTVTDESFCSMPNPNYMTNEVQLKPTTPTQDNSASKRVLDNGPAVRNTTFKSRMEEKSVSEDKSALVRPLAAPQLTKPLEDCTVEEGGDIILRSVITGTQPLRVSWLHNGGAVNFGKSSFDGSQATLVVHECLPEDAGAYTCTVENSVGKASSSAAVCVRDFESICGINNKKPSALLSNCVTGNKSTKDPCTTQNNNLHGGRIISDKLQTKFASSMKGITPKRRASSGTDPPVRFEEPPEQVEVRVGEQAQLQCSFSSRFPVASCWIHNKQRVANSSRIRVEDSDRGNRLLISEARPDDAGSYTIVVRNRRGFAQHSIILSVIDRPQPPASCPVVSHLSSSSLVLSWSGPCYDGGSAVTGYVVEAKKEGPRRPGDWCEVTGSCKSTSYRVRSGLEPQGEYRFRVRAYNAVGVSEPSQESDTFKMDTKREVVEEPQEYVDITINTINQVTDHYNVLEKLGVGKFGQVFRLTHKETSRVCAGKFYKARGSKDKAAARREIELMNHLHHPKLVQCLGAYDCRSKIVMVMEYIAGGELFERIVDENFEHTEPTSVHYMQQIIEGVQYMHRQNIVHLDLKPENIVCMNTTGTLIKIIDFGLASKLDSTTPLKVMHGTPEFVAPEVIGFEPVGPATDMWSIGVICYILLSGESPFQGNSDDETLALVTAAQWEFDDESFAEITDQAKDFISGLLKKDMRQRLSCEKALAHPWMAAFASADPRSTKTLSKDKMRKFLAKRKWKKTGKALLALKRMAVLSNKSDGSDSPASPGEDSVLTPEAEHALKSLEEQLQCEPRFSQVLKDQTQPQGAKVHLTCHIQGYPDPEVLWLLGEEPVEESSCVKIEYEEDGRCALVLSSVRVEDSGVYTCRAINSLGEALCSCKLTVTGKI